MGGLKKWNRIVDICLIVTLIVVAIIALQHVFFANQTVFGMHIVTVQSGSMSPTIKTGSVIGINSTVDKEALKENDIIMFQREQGMYVTHRIVSVEQIGDDVYYKTKGDNNEAPDVTPVSSEQVIGSFNGMNIPLLGYIPSIFANSPIIFLLIPGAILVVFSCRLFLSGLKERKLKQDLLQASAKNRE
ncbi:signal peptidase I [Paenalkalicoccus suaedae]|uniref:Signal peptidase I n=1 Tax=Paenalkalicoccus suaedae TaxID=2592382 RepID=A0A859FF84_9BACI|nr:signal peptidase I [Paenalkalicoccus suaedae]QKS70896.1 signal peptidase I [Paenalkalicoccus suaedae]